MRALVVAIVYIVAGKIGLSLASVHPSASAVWAPTGIAIAAIILLGYRVWPAIFVGAFLVNLTTFGSIATSLGISAGNTLEGLMGAYLVNTWAGGKNSFQSTQNVFRFAILAGFLATTVSATVGVTTLCLAGLAQWSSFFPIWVTWWLGDIGGALIIAPLIITWFRNFDLRLTGNQWVEAGLSLLSLLIVGFVLFGPWASPSTKHYPIAYFILPLIIWIGFRFPPHVSATGVLLLSVIAVWGTLSGFGSFASESPNRSLLLLQGFMAVVSISSLSLSVAVSERQKTQKELLSTQEKLRLINERKSVEEELARAQAITHLGNFSWNMATNKVVWSDELYRIYGLQKGQFKGTLEDFLSHLHPDDREKTKQAIEESMREKKPFEFYERIIRPDGIVRILYTQGNVTVNDKGNVIGMFGACHDVTEAKELDQTKDEFVAIASHELRTPLSVIRGNASMLRGGLGGAIKVAGQTMIEQIYDESKRLIALVNDLLDVSRLSLGKVTVKSTNVDLRSLCNQVVDELVSKAKDKGIRLTYASGRVLRVRADPSATKQVLLNLLDNSIKYTPSGGTVTLSHRLKDGEVETWVTDTGRGIGLKEQAHLFERFQVAGDINTRKSGSTGLGLFISRHLVEKMGGMLYCKESKPGRGSTFAFTLPQAQSA